MEYTIIVCLCILFIRISLFLILNAFAIVLHVFEHSLHSVSSDRFRETKKKKRNGFVCFSIAFILRQQVVARGDSLEKFHNFVAFLVDTYDPRSPHIIMMYSRCGHSQCTVHTRSSHTIFFGVTFEACSEKN